MTMIRRTYSLMTVGFSGITSNAIYGGDAKHLSLSLVTATTASQLKRSNGPLMVISSAAAPSSLPSRRLPRRNARLSIGPDGGTPTAQ